MKKICALIIFLFLSFPAVGMKAPAEALYSQLATKEMPALRKELKEKDDTTLFELLSHHAGTTPNKVVDATSWELLSRLFAEDSLQEFFEAKKPLPRPTAQQEKVLKTNFLRFVGLYIAHPAPNAKQRGALNALQELPESSIADFVFVSNSKFTGTPHFFNTQKLLVLKNDYKTLGLFNPYRKQPELLSELVWPGTLIQVYVQPKAGEFVPFAVQALDENSYEITRLFITGDKISVNKSLAATQEETYSLRRILLTLFYDLHTQKVSHETDPISLDNLLFLAYLYTSQHFASETMPLNVSYTPYYMALSQEIRDRLKLTFAEEKAKKAKKKTVGVKEGHEIIKFKVEKDESSSESDDTSSSEDEAAKKKNLIKRAAQLAWWKQQLSGIWNLVKSPFVFMWTKISGWWK
jgi:hypothetical protein